MKLRFALILFIVALAANAARLAWRALGSAPPDASPNLAEKGSAPSAPARAAWSTVHSDDLATFAANLRAAGFPDRLVRALLAAEIDDRFRARETALRSAKKTPYWQLDFTSEPLETRLARLDLKREKARLREQLLGPDPVTAEDESIPVAAEKRGQLRMLIEDYGALIADARSRAGAGALAGEKKELEFLESEQKRELAALLAPVELAEFEVARSGAVLDLRRQLRYFEPTDAEFAVIAAVAKARRDESSPTEARVSSAAAQQAREAAVNRQEADLKAVLGEQRYAEFQRASDADYRLLRDLSGRAQLPPDHATIAFDVRTATLAAATQLADDKSMETGAKKSAVAQLVDETRVKLRGVLGSDVADAYLRAAENSNSWLGYLARGIVQTPMPSGRVAMKPIYSGATPFPAPPRR